MLALDRMVGQVSRGLLELVPADTTLQKLGRLFSSAASSRFAAPVGTTAASVSCAKPFAEPGEERPSPFRSVPRGRAHGLSLPVSCEE